MDDYCVPLQTDCVYHDPDFLTQEQSNTFYRDLLQTVPWQKTSKINRWVHLCQEQQVVVSSIEDDEDGGGGGGVSLANSNQQYSYRDAPTAANGTNDSSFTDVTPPFPPAVETIRRACQEWYREKTGFHNANIPPFNVCLLNFYQDGTQRIGWHSDREEIGRSTPIASVSLGATRQFLIRAKEQWNDQATLSLQGGSLVVMENICQLQYLHAVPKEVEITEGRINLTFRCKLPTEDTTAGEELHRQRDDFMSQISKGTTPNTNSWSRQSCKEGKETTARITPIFGDYLRLEIEDGSTNEGLDPSLVVFLVKANLGAERYCAAELEERILEHGWEELWGVAVRPFDFDGFVACCRLADNIPDSQEQDDAFLNKFSSMLLKLQSAHHVLRYHCHFRLQDCVESREADDPDFKEERIPKEALYEHVNQRLTDGRLKINVMESSERGGTFRVTCERIGGPHAWQAPEVEYEIGGALAEFYERHNWKPKMEGYDVEIRTDVVGKRVIMGTQLNVYDLSKGRHFLKYRNAVTLKANLAYAMIRLANLKMGDHLLDPFCGSGTLMLEALQMYQGKIQCLGMDVSRRSAEGAKANAEAEGFLDQCRFVCSDARGLRRHVKGGDDSVDAIATNLPWGVMTGQNQSTSDLQTLYEVFLRNSWYVLKPYGRLVMLVLRGLQVVRTIRKLSGRYRLLHVNVVRTTNNLPSIIVVEKLPIDEVREALKGQLCHLNPFVSVSPEIYQSIHMEEVWDNEE